MNKTTTDLPKDILNLVFNQALESDVKSRKALGSVCTKWRSVAANSDIPYNRCLRFFRQNHEKIKNMPANYSTIVRQIVSDYSVSGTQNIESVINDLLTIYHGKIDPQEVNKKSIYQLSQHHCNFKSYNNHYDEAGIDFCRKKNKYINDYYLLVLLTYYAQLLKDKELVTLFSQAEKKYEQGLKKAHRHPIVHYQNNFTNVLCNSGMSFAVGFSLLICMWWFCVIMPLTIALPLQIPALLFIILPFAIATVVHIKSVLTKKRHDEMDSLFKDIKLPLSITSPLVGEVATGCSPVA